MNNSEAVGTTTLNPALDDRRGRLALGVVAFAVLAAFAAQVAVRLPWTPVPVTLQTLAVVLAGVVLGARAGALAMAAYVTVGALGAPVFSNGGAGLPWLLGPTGGYLLAAPAAAYVAGRIGARDAGAARLLIGLVAGVATMYLGGLAQLAALTGRGVAGAFAVGVAPFLVGDGIKILVAFFGVLSLRRVGGSED